MKQRKGFIKILILIAVIVGVVIIGGGGYFGYIQFKNYQAQQAEKEKQAQELFKAQQESLEGAEKEIENLKSQQNIQSKQLEIRKKSDTNLTNAEIIQKIKPAVVYIETIYGVGSGIIIDSDGFILTNAHVVEGVNSAQITTSDEKSFNGVVIGRNEHIDLALLKINRSGLPMAEFGNSDEDVLRQGDAVFTLGYPFGLWGDVSFKEGTISRRFTYDGIIYLETSAEIHPGNSGGPLVNKFGQVVGINTSRYGQKIEGVSIGEAIKWAIPIDMVNIYIPSLKGGTGLQKESVPSNLNVSLSSETPVSGTVIQGKNPIFSKFRFCASSLIARINKINVTAGGSYSDADIFALNFYHEGIEVPFGKIIDLSTHTGYSPLEWEIPANTCKILTVGAMIEKDAVVGDTIRLSILSASDINANVPIEGNFPIHGSIMTITK